MRFLRTIWYFVRDTYRDRYAIWQLTKRDFKTKYIGSTLGFVWSIIQPFVMILVLWFVFEKGLRVAPVSGDVPFIVWLTPGIIAWDYFSTTFAGSTSVFESYSYLVKKINFRISILPIVKILSSAITHILLLAIALIVLIINGVQPSWYWLQGIYYFGAMMVFVLGMSWIASSLQVFIKDVAQFVTTILQIGFWYTPIFWDSGMIPEQYQFIFKINPMFYIVEGYRRSFVYHAPFWEARDLGLYFWGFTLIVLLFGLFLFKRLRPHFADVL